MSIKEYFRRLDLRGLPWWKRGLVRTVQFVQALWGQVQRDKVIIRASGLAYSSLLAAVPLVAVAFAMFSAFGAFDDVKQKVQDFLFSQFLPTSQDEIVSYFNQFADGASKLGIIGFLLLVLAAILLLDNIESNFNNIWHVTNRRRIIAKITSFTSVLVFGTLFIGASFTISARIKRAVFFDVPFDPGTLERIGAWLGPLVLTFFAFLLMYLIIPFTRVQFKSALFGAVFGSVLWELGKNLFGYSVGHSVLYSTVYGLLAVIPIFLIWLYITWIIVLLGLEIAFTHQHFGALVRSHAAGGDSQRDRVSVALQFYALIAQRFCKAQPPPTADELSRRFLIATGVVESYLERLLAAGLARKVAVNSGSEGIVPSRPLDELPVSEVMRVFMRSGDDEHRQRPIELKVEAILENFRSAGFHAVGEMSFREFVDGLDGKEPDATQ